MDFKIILNNKIKFKRADVGDRYVKVEMQKNNFNLGGEQSGHIIFGKFATTGDGLLVGMVLFQWEKEKGFEIFNSFKATPQILENIKVKDKSIINTKNAEMLLRNLKN